MNEYTSVEAVELFITESLLKGGKVVIPDFGHLEIKSLGDRRTVLYKAADSTDSFLRIMSAAGEKEKKDTNAIYTIISIPLKDGKVVNLPKVGVFRPDKRENGEIHVSFILSSYLRTLLNNEEEKKEDVKETKEKTEKIPDTLTVEKKAETQGIVLKKEDIPAGKTPAPETGGKSEPTAVSVKAGDSDKRITPNPLPINKQKQTERGGSPSAIKKDTLSDNTRKKSRSKNISGILLSIAAVVVLILIVVSTIHLRNKEKSGDRVLVTLPSESINLPTLAELHYGHPAFWIYIYEANLDKLNSPVNISKNISLVIPDLKAEYDVDVNDSLEIQRANILADIVLKERMKKNK
ncbi:MAG: hypothetical protein FWF53_08395 [Candidatus Azobacteroides sp.]|nr:hypothetical protein [Candidatus Azobacteroides sp.]